MGVARFSAGFESPARRSARVTGKNDEARMSNKPLRLSFRHSSFVIPAPSTPTRSGRDDSELHQQLVREHAQTIDRRGLNSQNDRAQGDGAAALAAGERKLGGRKIAFGTHEHQDARRPVAVLG